MNIIPLTYKLTVYNSEYSPGHQERQNKDKFLYGINSNSFDEDKVQDKGSKYYKTVKYLQKIKQIKNCYSDI